MLSHVDTVKQSIVRKCLEMLTYSTDLQLHNSVFQTDTEGTAKTVKRFCY